MPNARKIKCLLITVSKKFASLLKKNTNYGMRPVPVVPTDCVLLANTDVRILRYIHTSVLPTLLLHILQ